MRIHSVNLFYALFCSCDDCHRHMAANILPKQECTVAEIAPGKHAMGCKFGIDRANTTASAEFCIPTSIEMVRAVNS